jgi:hypothetical protein
LQIEDTLCGETGGPADGEPLRKIVIAAAIRNPFAGKFVQDITLAHKDALYVRSHYDTITALLSDAPNRDEVLVIWAFATRGRLNARLGGLQASEVKGEDGLH